MLNSVKYEYFDLFTVNLFDIKSFLKTLKETETKIAYIDKKHLYLLVNNVVYGLSFNDTYYIEIEQDKIVRLLKNEYNVKFITNNITISNSMRKIVKENSYMIPYMYLTNQE